MYSAHPRASCAGHGAPLLLSGGADGHLHAWRLPDLLLAAQPWSAALAACGPTPAGRPAAGPTPPPAPGLRPLLTTKLPPPGGVNTWGQREEAAGPGQPGPGVLCLAVDPGAQQVFLGESPSFFQSVQVQLAGSHL